MRILSLITATLATFALTVAAGANEWVDMGPLKGSVEGHIWSRVVDEVGNTQGRNEIWQFEFAAPAMVEFIIKCPDPYRLEVVIPFKDQYGFEGEWKPERVADGFYQKVGPLNPETTRDIRVIIQSRKPSTDQRYQLTVTLDGVPMTGKARPPDAAADPSDGLEPNTDRAGSDYRRDVGVATAADCRRLCLADSGCDSFTWVRPGLQEVQAVCYLKRGTPTATRSDCCVSGRVTARDRGPDPIADAPPAPDSWPTPPAPSTAAPEPQPAGAYVNLALGRPTRQSSIYLGTGVDQGPQHAVDGITAGRDPHDLIHTNEEARPYWMVDLGTVASIDQIRLFNRTNPDLETNLAIQVLVSEDGNTWRTLYTHNQTPWVVLPLPVRTHGRWVLVQLAHPGALQLYEVEVWGTRPP